LNEPKFIIGIDLGTTHCVLAYTLAEHAEDQELSIELFAISQLINSGELKESQVLPSFILIPASHEVPEGGLSLPWSKEMDYTVGEFARNRGAELPQRLVSSSKSWLCNGGVDRTQAILPWDSAKDARRISPLEASSKLLIHLRDAWNYKMANDDASLNIEHQEIYLTVPASFDAVARELTVQAARMAGMENLTLLEEPQAAFYAWLESQKGSWRDSIQIGESILVCDVGGGTTDFSLIRVAEENGNLELTREAVGDHILLGGDNMDLTLAYHIQTKLAQQGTKLDNWQFRGLWHSCRAAKERLLSNPDLETEPVSILGRGSSLIGGTIRTEITRQDVQNILLNGFFTECSLSDYPEEKARVGIREMGLPYESDPAITKHLAKFLGKQTQQNNDSFPSTVLFNGGVMKASPLRERIKKVLQSWGSNQIHELPSVDLDLAVAQGAAYYGLARKGKGIRIKAGIARTYYIGIESAMPSVPGVPTPIKALCVVPFGMEEGSEADIQEKEFGLVVGEHAIFHLLASNLRKEDSSGEIVDDWSSEIEEVTTMETKLPATEEDKGGKVIPVWLQSKVTEVGTLELWCVSRDDDRRWKLEFNIREREEG
jgi:molecular chaperone DnaK (HSP70)